MKIKVLLLSFLIPLAILFAGCETFDDSAIWDKLNNLEQRVNAMESTLTKLNSDLNTMSSMVNVLSNNLSITNVSPVEGGFRISFSNGSSYTIQNGKNGMDGQSPVIGVKEYGNRYYWTQTVNGASSWITDDKGNKIPASGADGVTPLLKVSVDGYWMVSYDQGISFEYIRDTRGHLVPATGKGGDSFFQNVTFSDGILTLILYDGTVIRFDLNEQKDPRMDSVLPEELQLELEKYMPIYNGILPPDVQGTYYVSPFVAVYCEDYGHGGYAPGTEVYPVTIRFSNQNFKTNTLDYHDYQTNASSTGVGALICGSRNNFSAYFSTAGTAYGISYRTVLIVSGTKTDEGIKDLYYAFGMVEKGDDPEGILMDEEVFRVFKDSDGLSVNSTWNPTKSPFLNVSDLIRSHR